MDPSNITKENTAKYSSFDFEYFMPKDITLKIAETLEKSWLFNYSESESLGIISAVTQGLEFIDKECASEITEKLQKKRRGKNASHQVIDLLKSFLKIKDEEILKQLENVPIFDTDNDYI